MQLEWELTGDYAEIGGVELVRAAVENALTVLPREHLRQLALIAVEDEDPRGKALGIWRLDHRGAGIALYAQPHVRPLLRLPPDMRALTLRLHLGYTLFHEVGHHVTRLLNKRAAPPRKAALVEQKIERWADDYAEKRLGKLVASWLEPGGLAGTLEERQALSLALHALRLDMVVTLDVGPSENRGTNETETPS